MRLRVVSKRGSANDIATSWFGQHEQADMQIGAGINHKSCSNRDRNKKHAANGTRIGATIV